MILSLIVGLGLPLLGTTAGAACVFFMKKQMNLLLQKALSGFAAGVMVAASMEPADPGDGTVGSNGEACISSGNYRFLAGNYIFITDRYSDATFTY